MGIEDAIADLRWHGGTSSGILEHIVEQYKLKMVQTSMESRWTYSSEQSVRILQNVVVYLVMYSITYTGKTMTNYYKGDSITKLLNELRRAELVFNSVNAEELNQELWNKLIAAKAMVAINKAKLTSLQD